MCWSRSLIAPLLLLSAASHVPAQALHTATKTADLSGFFGYTTAQPDYGPNRNSGGTLGVNLTRYFHFPVAPSIELRANFVNGPVVNERSYLVGLRAHGQIGRWRPYGNFLVGPGNLHFNFPSDGYTGDNSIVYSYGGGIEIDVVNNFAAKVDYQGQHWRTGLGTSNTFTPSLLMIGFAYHFQFEPHTRQGTTSH